ncbi:acylamino-acid-releasing enzyme isoform X2 [Diachasma alloeum]|uniref:acylamino-acid-releasing enzyme isoform X2 n=1 Tax=Diachasma alloeum TaxID=454923 RepID=UPI0007384CE7|nr:acylamino-acid-releasing enzyme isoform X2 [Diachasma alloeum]
MSSEEMEKILKLYKTIAQNPSLTAAKIVRTTASEIAVESTWSQRNLERTTNQKFQIEYSLTSNFQVQSQSFPVDITSELASKTTDDNQRKAVLRTAPGKEKDAPKQFIEIWDQRCQMKNYDLSALDVHGDVYTDSEFGSFQWSPDATKLLYIAEKKLPKSEPFYKQKPQDKKSEDKAEKEDKESKDEPEKEDKKSDKPEKEEPVKGNEYIYKPDWGEALEGKHQQVVVVLDTTTDTLTVLPGIDESLSPGQVVWTPNGDGVVGIAWNHEPRYLGLIACTNRESWVFLLKNGTFQKLSADKRGVRSPRFSPDGKKLVWLERELNGPHHTTHRLMSIDWESEERTPSILIDLVKTKIDINKGVPFYGLYNRDLPRRCWSKDSRYLFLSTPQRSNVRSYALNTETKVLTEIDNDDTSLVVLDVSDNVVLMLNTSLLRPSRLVATRFEGEAGKVELSGITEARVIEGMENLKAESVDYVYEGEETVKDFNFTYFGPQSGGEREVPLIIVPHGGPHANYANIFYLEYSLLALLGYGIVQVNYRGSTGMGLDNVEYLQGRVGDVDVKDCVTATREALKKYPWLDPDRVALSGGSHGGFLVTHLSGQYPTMYKAVVARNPVIDIAAMFTISDIPDWCAAVTNSSYDEMSSEETAEMVVKMFKCSPIVHAHKVKAPTLMLIGKNDLRVPPSQGKHWYLRLKANGVKTKMLVYADNHPLSTGPVEIDEIINAILWFNDNLNAKVNDHIKSD